MSDPQQDDHVSSGTVVQAPATAGAAAAEAPVVNPGSSDLTGVTLLGRYLISKKLGEGGMGTVYLGEHTTIRKKFAIKVLSQEFAHKSDLVQRFLQEARAASMISQENVVEITDFGDTPDGSVFFVMEHLKGEDLSDTVKNLGALPWDRVKGIMLQICAALSAAHEVGIIHRDMKPENCFRITRSGNEDFIKVLDFGIAKVTSDEGDGGKGLTRTGMIFGTPEYMSPEQAQGQKVDHRVDVYATGVIMYELLTGRVPFTADTFMGILTKHMFDVPEAPSAVNPNNGITAEMEAIMLKAMQKDRDLRFQDMEEFAAAVKTVGTGGDAVQVVSENIARPDAGQMAFVGGGAAPALGAAPAPGTYPPPAGTYPPQGGTYPPMVDGYAQRSKLPLALALIAGLGIAGGAGYYFGVVKPNADVAAQAQLEAQRKTAADELAAAQAAEAATAATQAAEAAAAAAPPPQKQLDAAAPRITMRIKTAVQAQILDAADGAIFGVTNSDDGVEFEKSKEAIALILHAPGYEDLPFNVVPNRDKDFEKTLLKSKKRTIGKKKKTKTKTTTVGKTPEVKTKPKPPGTNKPKVGNGGSTKKKKVTKGNGHGSSPDLKDPFG